MVLFLTPVFRGFFFCRYSFQKLSALLHARALVQDLVPLVEPSTRHRPLRLDGAISHAAGFPDDANAFQHQHRQIERPTACIADVLTAGVKESSALRNRAGQVALQAAVVGVRKMGTVLIPIGCDGHVAHMRNGEVVTQRRAHLVVLI